MRKVFDAYPDDLDAAAIFAEALMDLRPWEDLKSNRGSNALRPPPPSSSRHHNRCLVGPGMVSVSYRF
jgi:hypothetical protein